MSGRVCYVSSTDRGDRLATVRLIGARGEDGWRSTGSTEPLAVLADVSSAAEWISERAGSGDGRAGELGLICIDVEGANCVWLTAPSTDSAVVAAALAQAGDGESARVGGAWASPTLAEASVEALAGVASNSGGRAQRGGSALALVKRARGGAESNGHAGSQRLAVLAIPDVSARLLLDALDERGLVVDRVVSLWHALAAAWDRSPQGAGRSGNAEVVATNAPVIAVVLVDPAGRLVWAWSRAGELLAAGTIRLPQERQDSGPGTLRIGRAEIGRLTTDWLSWSVQIGAAPARIVCVVPQTGEDDNDDDLTPSGIGAALGRAWAGATVDLAVHADPIGATLSRLVDSESVDVDDARHTLTILSHRPGRAHRTLYLWSAGCLAAVAVALTGVGWQAQSSAAQARSGRDTSRTETMRMIEAMAPPTGQRDRMEAMARPREYMKARLESKRQAINPNLDPPKPILAELDVLSYVLGTPEVEIDEISLMSHGVQVYVRVPDTATAEMLKASLDSIADTNCDWAGSFPTTPGRAAQQKTSYFLQGRWRTPGPGAGGSASASAGGRP